MSERDFLAACRRAGYSELARVGVLVLEPTGDFSILEAPVPGRPPASRETLRSVSSPGDEP